MGNGSSGPEVVFYHNQQDMFRMFRCRKRSHKSFKQFHIVTRPEIQKHTRMTSRRSVPEREILSVNEEPPKHFPIGSTDIGGSFPQSGPHHV